MHSPAMPTVSALFSGPVSVGLLAGVVSGLFYLVVAGIRWAGRLREAREREEQRQLRRQERLEATTEGGGAGDTGEGVRNDSKVGGDAGDCNAPAREVKQQSGEWLYRQVQRRLHPASSAGSLCIADNGVGMEPETVRVREFIERLVESLVSGELDNVCIKRLHSHPEYDRMFACHHAPLCEALARLSFALQMAIANKHMADYNSPSAAHAALKQLVYQIIQEAMSLPKFKGVRPTEDDMKSLEDMESKTYEDILATAILNKVIERYQQRDSTSRAALDGNSNLLSPELMTLVAMHQPLHHNYSESGGNPRRSIDDGDSMSELSNTDPLSVTIEECIEEVTTFSNAEDDADDVDSYLPGLDVFKNRRAPFPEYGRDIIDGPPLDASETEEDEDEVPSEDETSMQPTDVINPVDSWEENWLFQKRRLKVGGVAQPMPVPMLVPNPSEDYRALIGDRDAEDVSDLSDCSDGALEDLIAEDDIASGSAPETTPASAASTKENIEVNSIDVKQITPTKEVEKSVKNNEMGCVPDHADKETVLRDSNKEATYDIRELTEAKNMEYLKPTADDCLSEFGQQEGEYTEDYATVTQRQLDSLTAISDPDSGDIPELPSSPIPQLSPGTSTIDESVVAILDDLIPGESETDDFETVSMASTDLAKPPRPGIDNLNDEYCSLPISGTIAEREHKKWETAPPLPNNPYSPENIIKRLSKRQHYNQTNSNSDATAEHSESNDTAGAENVVEQPLQVICSPSDVDHKRYGRDYYINAQPATNSVKTQSNTSSPQQQELPDEKEAMFAEFPNRISSKNDTESSDTHDSNNIETKVALWQRDINEADQYYQNILNKKQEHVEDIPSNETEIQTETSFFRSMLSSSNEYLDNDETVNMKPKNKNKLREKLKEFEKIEKNGIHSDKERSFSEIKSKFDNRSKKVDANFESLSTLRRNSNMGSSLSLHENGNDVYTNGYARSDSPSGSSVLTSDSDYSMPSVRELTKRFSGLVDSDSSTSSPKSVSPAPQSRIREPWLKKMKDETKAEAQGVESNLNPPRPVREIHSLTARSISREFREELRHNQPILLNKNIYKQINPKFINGVNNDIVEENSTSNNSSISSAPKSPVPCRSMRSNIAFWEQMQNNK